MCENRGGQASGNSARGELSEFASLSRSRGNSGTGKQQDELSLTRYTPRMIYCRLTVFRLAMHDMTTFTIKCIYALVCSERS